MAKLLPRILGRVQRAARRVRDRAIPREHQLLFACMGGSGAWAAMGRESYAAGGAFRDSIDASGRIVEEMLGWDAASFFRGEETNVDRRAEIILLGMVQLAQVDLWREAGVVPRAVVAVSLGEMIAPYVADALSRADSMRVVTAMAHAVSRGDASARMFLLDTDFITARRLARTAPAPLHFLGNSSPRTQILLALEEHAADAREFLGGGIIKREIPTPWTYHTPRHDMDVAWFHDVLRAIEPRRSACPVYSSATGGLLPADFRFDSRFFAWMATYPFHFADAVSAALADGFDTIVSIGAHASLNRELAATAAMRGRTVTLFDSMRVNEESAVWKASRAAVTHFRFRAPQARARATATTVDFTAPQNPFETYEELRRAGSVHFLPRHGFWIALDYADVQRGLADPQLFSSRMPALRQMDHVLVGEDPPEHTNARRILSRLFTPELVAKRGEIAMRVAERLLEPLTRGVNFDVVSEFADPLVETIAADLIGFDDVSAFRGPTLDAGGETAKLAVVLREPIDAAARRTTLYDELLREGLDDDGACSLIRLLWIASTTTTRRVIASSILLLLEHPDIRDPELLAAFVDEAIRLRPPEHMVPRVTTADVELGGVTIPRGSVVQFCLAAANRDPARFPEPHALRLDRAPNAHLSFAHGVHRCIGAALARAETLAALRALLHIAPGFRAIQPPAAVRYLPGAHLRALEQLVIAS